MTKQLLAQLSGIERSPRPIQTRRKDGPYVFLLGADDPEMITVQAILDRLNIEYYFATYNGVRVHVGNAYEADPFEVPKGMVLGLVECKPRNIENIASYEEFDHHIPGKGGYGLPPEQFLKASPIGQLCKHFGLKPTYNERVIAAMDHCMVHARKGLCPGVKPDDVKKLSKIFIAKRKGVTEAEVESCMVVIRQTLLTAPVKRLGNERVYDLMHVTWKLDSLEYLCARDVLADFGRAAIIPLECPEGSPDKIVIYGDAQASTIKAFVRWAQDEGLVGIYHDPERGYAGGYRTAPTYILPRQGVSVSA
jgi:hypothetical protein